MPAFEVPLFVLVAKAGNRWSKLTLTVEYGRSHMEEHDERMLGGVRSCVLKKRMFYPPMTRLLGYWLKHYFYSLNKILKIRSLQMSLEIRMKPKGIIVLDVEIRRRFFPHANYADIVYWPNYEAIQIFPLDLGWYSQEKWMHHRISIQKRWKYHGLLYARGHLQWHGVLDKYVGTYPAAWKEEYKVLEIYLKERIR